MQDLVRILAVVSAFRAFVCNKPRGKTHLKLKLLEAGKIYLHPLSKAGNPYKRYWVGGRFKESLLEKVQQQFLKSTLVSNVFFVPWKKC